MGTNPAYVFHFKKSSIAWWGFWLIIPFCSFTCHTYLWIPPTAVLFLIGCLIMIPLLADRIYHPTKLILPCILIVYFFISQLLMGAPIKHFMGVILAICYFIITLSLIPTLYIKGRKAKSLNEWPHRCYQDRVALSFYIDRSN